MRPALSRHLDIKHHYRTLLSLYGFDDCFRVVKCVDVISGILEITGNITRECWSIVNVQNRPSAGNLQCRCFV